MAENGLSRSEFVALKDCANFSNGSYVWKPKTMAKLAARGLVESLEGPYGMTAYALTKEGVAFLGGRK